ncbi:hypothetical protein [Polaribacter uvawellassae]|uniref:hypothetical protein n=1 Tax=Polaribacter uvawellassae TaxID=3133495 RepID=UPI003219F7E2
MKKIVLILYTPLVFQISENNQSQIVFDYIEYVILLICFMSASIVMMLIPIFLCYSMIDSFKNMCSYKKKIKEGVSCHQSNSKHIESICDKYYKVSSKFFKNLSALVTWNVFSFIYIFFGFDNFNDGLKEYFYFPFAVLQSLSKDQIFDTIYKFQSNWLFMGAIVLITFFFSFFGKYIGNDIAKNNIEKSSIKLTT